MNPTTERLSRLVVVIEDSDDVEAVLPWVRLLAEQLHLPIEFVAVVQPERDSRETRVKQAIAADYLQLLKSDSRLARIEVQTTLATGSMEDELPNVTRGQRGSILIVPRGRDESSIDNYMKATRALKSSFMVIPRNAHPPTTIRSVVVGNDRSPLAKDVLRTSQTFGSAMGLTVIEVEAIEPGSVPEEAFLAFQPVVTERKILLRGLGSRTLLATARSRDAAVIVVGRHGAGEAAPLTLGRTADWLTRHSDQPVVIVPELE